MDSPPSGQAETEGLHDKEDSYFDEIRNFIDKTTTDSREHETTPMKDYDTNFSITAQAEKHSQIYAAGEKRPRTKEDDENQLDDEDRLSKKVCVDNNNETDLSLSKSAADLNSSNVSNGYHDSEEEDLEEDEQKFDEDHIQNAYKSASPIGLTKNGITAPLALST